MIKNKPAKQEYKVRQHFYNHPAGTRCYIWREDYFLVLKFINDKYFLFNIKESLLLEQFRAL